MSNECIDKYQGEGSKRLLVFCYRGFDAGGDSGGWRGCVGESGCDLLRLRTESV